MAQTAAQKAAAEKKANLALLAKAQEQLAKVTASTSKANASSTAKSSDYAQRNAGFNANGTIKTPEQTAASLAPINAAAAAKTAQAKEDTYYTAKVGTSTKTQAQLDVAANARDVAKSVGGSIDPTTGFITKKGTVTTVDKNGDGVIDDAPGVIPGSSGGNTFAPERTLAADTFKNTLALLFGTLEASQSWVSEIFGLASGFYKTGSTIEEALNLSLYDAKSKGMAPAFTKRFDGVFKLQDRLNKGEAIEVPTIAEFIKSESAMGDVLRQAGMGDLANQEFLGNVIGLGKSVAEVTTLIDDTFNRIDNAPEALKNDLKVSFPGVSRTDIAKAMLMGTEGAKALNKKIEGLTVMSAAKSQGIGIDAATAGDLAARGYGYDKSLEGFGTVKRLERGQFLGKMSGIDLTQQEAISSTFAQDVKAQDKIARIAEEEVGRFSSRSGRLASQNRSTAGLI